MTAGEVTHSHMVVQEHNGWTVHTYNPVYPEHQFLDGSIREVDDHIQTKAHTRMMLTARELSEADRIKNRTHLRRLKAMRDHARSIPMGE